MALLSIVVCVGLYYSAFPLPPFFFLQPKLGGWARPRISFSGLQSYLDSSCSEPKLERVMREGWNLNVGGVRGKGGGGMYKEFLIPWTGSKNAETSRSNRSNN